MKRSTTSTSSSRRRSLVQRGWFHCRRSRRNSFLRTPYVWRRSAAGSKPPKQLTAHGEARERGWTSTEPRGTSAHERRAPRGETTMRAAGAYERRTVAPEGLDAHQQSSMGGGDDVHLGVQTEGRRDERIRVMSF
jgi:hypothetical protein